ncbi:MAG: hypothetical protein ACI4SG_08685 [Oligosphaeraceae bacterium]
MEQKINVVLTADSHKATNAIDKGTEAVKRFSGAYDSAAESIKTASGTIADSSQSAKEKEFRCGEKQAGEAKDFVFILFEAVEEPEDKAGESGSSRDKASRDSVKDLTKSATQARKEQTKGMLDIH